MILRQDFCSKWLCCNAKEYDN